MFGAQRISFCQGQYKRTRPPFKCWFYHVRASRTPCEKFVCLLDLRNGVAALEMLQIEVYQEKLFISAVMDESSILLSCPHKGRVKLGARWNHVTT
ncbi:uncharacterized protein LOC144762776 isoform X4 [Lissotriton helveticus]